MIHQRKEKPMHGASGGRRCLLGLLVVVTALLVGIDSAWAHARISPVVVESKQLQLFSLAVPTEKDNLTTTKVELTVPQGFGSTRSRPPPAGSASAGQTGSGEDAVIQKVTWTGGSVRTGEDSLFQFLADRRRARPTRSASARPTRTARWSTGPAPRARTRPRPPSRRRRRWAAAGARRSRSSP